MTRHYISNTRKRRTASPTWNYKTPLLVPRNGHSSLSNHSPRPPSPRDTNLNWSSHVQSLVSMASKRSGLLRLMSHQLPRAVTIRLFKSYLRPTMEYASAVWHGSLKEEDALSIERIQAGVARCLLKADWCTPKPTLLEQLDWPALRWRREIASLTFFHKIIPGQRQLPPLTDCLFPFAHSVSNRSQRKPLQLLLPQTRSTRFTKSFFYRSALL